MAGDPYAHLSDIQVFEHARAALVKASILAPGSVQRSIAFAVYDSYAQELDRRAIRHILAKLREQDG